MANINPFNTQIEAGWLAGIVNANTALATNSRRRRWTIKRRKRRTRHNGPIVRPQPAETFDTTEIGAEGPNDDGHGGGREVVDGRDERSGRWTDGDRGQDKKLNDSYAASEKQYAIDV